MKGSTGLRNCLEFRIVACGCVYKLENDVHCSTTSLSMKVDIETFIVQNTVSLSTTKYKQSFWTGKKNMLCSEGAHAADCVDIPLALG